MKKAAYKELIAARDNLTTQINSLNATIDTNTVRIKKAMEDKLAAIRAKDQAAASAAQFSIDALQLENNDLQAKISALQSQKYVDQSATDAAWAADLLENPDYLGELALFKTVASLYDAVCVRAKNEHQEWADLGAKLTDLCQNKTLYGIVSPGIQLETRGFLGACKEQFYPGWNSSECFTHEAIDKLIALLQQIKGQGVESIL